MKVLIVASLLIAQVLSQGDDDMMSMMMIPPETSHPELRAAIFLLKHYAGGSIQMSCTIVETPADNVASRLFQLVKKIQERTGFDGMQLMNSQLLARNYRLCGGFGVFKHLRETEQAAIDYAVSLKDDFCYSDEEVLEEIKAEAEILYNNLHKVAEERFTVAAAAFEARVEEVYAKLEAAGEGKSDYSVDTAFVEIDQALIKLKSDVATFAPYYTPHISKVPVSKC